MPRMQQSQVAIVTGGGRGIGRAIALALAGSGASVAVLARSAGEIEETAALITAAGGVARAWAVDVTDAGAVGRGVNEVGRALGPVDVLMNNAGILGPIAPFWESSVEDWWRTADVNLRAPILCTHAVLPSMIARRRGRIVNVVTGAAPIAYFSAYVSSKSALIRFSECLAIEVRPFGLSVFAMGPGTVRTRMSGHSLNSLEGRSWIPWFRRIFDEGLDLPVDRPAALAAALASGAYDGLSGLTLTPFDDLDAMREHLPEIERDRLYTMRIRTLSTTPASAALAAIRADAERPREPDASSPRKGPRPPA